MSGLFNPLYQSASDHSASVWKHVGQFSAWGSSTFNLPEILGSEDLVETKKAFSIMELSIRTPRRCPSLAPRQHTAPCHKVHQLCRAAGRSSLLVQPSCSLSKLRPTCPGRTGNGRSCLEDDQRTPRLCSQLFSGASCTKPELTFQSVRAIFPFLTMKANMKTFISPLEPTSPEISVLRQAQDALVRLYGLRAGSEVSWLSRIRKPSHKGFFNPFY